MITAPHPREVSTSGEAAELEAELEMARERAWRERSPVLVGRERELELLERCAAAAPAVVVVAGEAGAGKSRLVAEALALPGLAGHQRLVGRCHPRREPFPLGVLIDSLRHVHAMHAPSVGAHAAAAWRPLVPELDRLLPRHRRHPGEPGDAELLDGLVGLVGRLGPAVLVVEDLQWCDPRSASLLHGVVERLPAEAVMVVTRRAGDAGMPALTQLTRGARPGTTVESLTVAPLAGDDVRRLAVAISGCEVSEEFAVALRARTGGLPRLVEVAMRQVSVHPEVVADHGLEPARALGALDVPGTLGDEILSAASSLGGHSLRLMEAASVLGTPQSAPVLGAVADLPAPVAERAARLAADHGILIEQRSRWGFRAPLAARAVYDAIPGPSRRHLHERAAGALGARRPRAWAELARHHRECGDVVEWARCVDEATASLVDPAASVELLREVILEPGISPATRARLAARLGTAALRAQAPATARPLLSRVIDEHPLTGVRRADVRWSLGCLHLAVGDADGWRDQRVAAAEDLRRRPDLAALVMMELAMPWVEHGRLDEHRRWLERASAAAARQRDPVVTLCVAVATALVPLYVGDPTGWEAMNAIPWNAASLAEQLQLTWAVQNLAGACFHLGHYDRARRLYDEGVRRASELARNDRAHVFRAADISLAWCTGRWEGLDGAARQYIRDFSDLPGWTLHGKLVLGHLQLARGELQEAEQLLRDAAEAAHEAGAIPVIAGAAGGLARLALVRGEPDAARALAGEAVGLLARKGIWAWAAPVAPPAVEAMIAADRVSDATELVARFQEGLAGRDAPLAQAALELCAGMTTAAAGDHAGAEARLAVAVRSFEALPRPHDAATAMTLRGHSLMELGDPRGPEVLRSALAVLESLDASADAGRVRRALRQRSVAVPRPWRGGRSGYGTRLSPRQEEVIELALAGRTNDEIAQALFISEKTVEDHLGSAMQKLGVSSKRELRRSAAGVRRRRGEASRVSTARATELIN